MICYNTSCSQGKDIIPEDFILVKLEQKEYAAVAQLDRVPDSDSGGRGFESRRPYQNTAAPQRSGGFFNRERDSNRAVVNGVPVARQSREAARLQAGNPVGRTKNAVPFGAAF